MKKSIYALGIIWFSVSLRRGGTIVNPIAFNIRDIAVYDDYQKTFKIT